MPECKKPVGYCSPPVETRFKKGVSGNPRGRPRKVGGIGGDDDELAKMLFGKNKLTVGGRPVAVRGCDVMLREQYKAALNGNYKMALELLRLHRDAQRRRQQLNGPRRWLTLPPIFRVPALKYHEEIVPWDTLYGDAKRAGLVPADRAGRWWVRPDWLKRELKRQGDAAPKRKQRPMDAAIERAFKTRVPAKKAGIEVKVPLSKALYLKVIEAAAERPSVMRALNRMTEESHVEAVQEEELDDGSPSGCLIVADAPDTIEEWLRLYGDKANGNYGRQMRAEYEASRR